MPKPAIVVTDVISAQMQQAIGDGLNAFNDEVTGVNDRKPLAVVVSDGNGAPVGGAIGRTSLGLAFLDLFFLPEALRGAGLGTQVLRAFEEEARKRGCRAAVLYTISFQAPDFYARNGWRRFGDIPCDPPGTSRIFMTKDL